MDKPIIVHVSAPTAQRKTERAAGIPRPALRPANDFVKRGREAQLETQVMRQALADSRVHILRLEKELDVARKEMWRMLNRPAWKWFLRWWLGIK